MRRTLQTVILAGLVSWCSAQDAIYISGTVVDNERVPLVGARVTLTGPRLVVNSGSDGTFNIVRAGSPVQRGTVLGSRGNGHVSIVNGTLRLVDLTTGERVRAGIFDATGRQVCTAFDGPAQSASQSIDLRQGRLSEASSSVYLLRVEIGGQVTTHKLLYTANTVRGSLLHAGTPARSNASLAKSLAVSDTLTYSRRGYADGSLVVSSYTQSGLILVAQSLHQSVPGKVTGLAATYDRTRDTVTLTWSAASSATFDFYRIYRTMELNQSGSANCTTLVSLGAQWVVSKTSTTFAEPPGIADGIYWYCIRAAKIVSGDTVLGVLSDPAPVLVRMNSGAAFSINRGAIFTVMDRCSLTLSDPLDTSVSVRFTQSYRQYLVKDNGTRVQVSFDDPYNPPISDTVRSLITGGWLNSSAQIATGVRKIEEPEFEATDPLNTTRSIQTSLAKSLAWNLLKGNGSKKVWAEVTYKGGEKDTLNDIIEIAPYAVSIVLDTADSTMRTELVSSTLLHYLYRPWVEFSVSAGTDTTFQQGFDYWLILPDSQAFVDPDIRSEANAWIETVPRSASLGTDSRLRYTLDPSTAEGQANLTRLVRTRSAPVPPSMGYSPSFALYGPTGKLNSTCVPGSYWGPRPLRWNSTTRQLDAKQDTLRGDSDGLYRRVTYLGKLSIAQYGKKEFVVVALLKGKYFNDTRVMVSGGKLMESGGLARFGAPVISYFDWYHPAIFLNKIGADFLTNGSVVQRDFTYTLSYSPSVQDCGRADIAKVELVIARKPANLAWPIDAYGVATAAASLTPEYVYGLRNELHPLVLPAAPSFYVQGASWNITGVADWASGDYIMGIVTEDEFGNRGWGMFTDATSASMPLSNPWLITAQTGR